MSLFQGVYEWGRVCSERAGRSGGGGEVAGRTGSMTQLLGLIHSTLEDYPEALKAVVRAVETWDGTGFE